MKPIILAGDKNQDGQGGVSRERMVGKCGEVWISVGEGGDGEENCLPGNDCEKKTFEKVANVRV